jgi:hypothetical protein
MRYNLIKSICTFILITSIFAQSNLAQSTKSYFKLQTKNSVLINDAKLKPTKSYDVVVCGGGPAGVAAAVSASRSGANVLLIELKGALGGVMTSGLLTYLLDTKNKEGIMSEIMLLLQNANSQLHPRVFDPEEMKYQLEKMCTDAGVTILYHSRVVNAVVKDAELKSVVTENAAGRQAYKAKVYIDCTGNGDLGALSGCKYALGSPSDNSLQAASMELIVSGINYEDMKANNLMIHPSVPYSEMAKQNLRNEILRAGVDPSYSHPVLTPIRNDFFNLCFNQQYNFNPLDAFNVSKATIDARSECHEVVNKLRALGGVWKNIRIVSTPEQLAIREARRIEGLYAVSKTDLITGARFDDGVVRATFPVDIHYGDSVKGKAYGDDGISVKPYDIPMRALIAKDVNNLMMAGRCISGDYFAHASYRVIGNAVAMGEAAGAFAAKAAHGNISPKKLVRNIAAWK